MKKIPTQKKFTAGGFKAMRYVMSCAQKVGANKLSEAVRSKNTCKACAFGTGGQRGGLHNEFSDRIEICNKNIQAQTSDIRQPIPVQIFEENSINELKALSPKQLEDLGRLATPLYKEKNANYFESISYAEAYRIIKLRLQGSDPTRSFFYASGRSSNEAAFILQLMARAYGCNHINNCSYYCHQASGVGLNASLGTGTSTIQYADLHKADLIFVVGANPASNHPRFVKVLLECRQRGGNVVVINPSKEAGLVRFASPANFKSMIAGGNEVASQFLQPHIGGDAALLAGIAKQLISQGEIDTDYINRYCSDFDEYKDFVNSLTWPIIERESGVKRQEIETASSLYQSSSKTIFTWGMGLTHHKNGTENIESIVNLALLRGMIGGEGKGLLPLRGHSNVQGVGSMGFTPKLKSQVFDSIERKYSIDLPKYEGMDTLACIQAAAKGAIDFALLLGGNLYAANPDTKFSKKALDSIPFKVMINSTLNETHLNGIDGENIILPVRVRDEEKQPTTQESMFNFLRMSDGGIDRINSLCSEVEIITSIASEITKESTLDFSVFREHKNIRNAIAELVPGFESLRNIDKTKQEFHISNRYFSKPKFKTVSGKANFKIPRHTNWQRRRNKPKNSQTFFLTSVRSEGQFNTIIYTEEDTYRRQKNRRVLFINPQDLKMLNLKEDDLVSVSNEVGKMENLALKEFDIRPGNVMTYFPEANVLVSQDVDIRSKTPSFKSVIVNLQKNGG